MIKAISMEEMEHPRIPEISIERRDLAVERCHWGKVWAAMRGCLWLIPLLLLSVKEARSADAIERIAMSPVEGMYRADIYVMRTVPEPRGIIVLCPGMNRNGEEWVQREPWQQFAKAHNLALAGVSFASSPDSTPDNKSYFVAGLGSGEILRTGLEKAFGKRLPILLYGFSNGAVFAASFVDAWPKEVIAWCTYAGGRLVAPKSAGPYPPGIVACGENDSNYGASLGYFLQGRALGKFWTWVSLANRDHQESAELEAFVRDYFEAVLQNEDKGVDQKANSQWRDVDLKTIVDPAQVTVQPTLACWLPNGAIEKKWEQIHHP